MLYLAGGAVANPLIGALGVGVVGSRIVGEVAPSDLIRASAVRAVAGLEKLFPIL